MPDVVELHGITLTPVIELTPGTFSTQARPFPSESKFEMPDEWQDYWRISLADAGITGLDPIAPGSWHVVISEVPPTQLEKILRVLIDEWGGIASLGSPDLTGGLSGGLALRSNDPQVCIEPTCCGDLRAIAEWKDAASFQGESWEMLWIGHPWLSMKFQQPWLLLSDYHESGDPAEKWALLPDELMQAVLSTEAELLHFSQQIGQILSAWNYEGNLAATSLKLAGLSCENS